MTEAEVEKLRSAGIDDAVILGLQKDEAVKNGQAAPVVQSKSALPEVNPNTPSTVFEQAQAAGVPTAGREQNWAQTALELAPVVGDTLVKAIPYVAGGVGLLGAGRLVNAAKTAAEAYKAGEATKAAAVTANSATHAATQEMKVLQQLAQQQGPHADAARQRLAQLIQSKGPTVPTAAPVVPSAVAPSSILDAQGRPMQMQPRPMPPAPAAPAYMPPAAPAPAAPAPSVIQRGTDIANQMRQYAAQRVIPAVSQAGQMVGRGLTAAAPALRVGGMASNALYSGGLNTDEQAELERRRKMAPTISR